MDTDETQVPVPTATGYTPAAVFEPGTVTGATLGNTKHDAADDTQYWNASCAGGPTEVGARGGQEVQAGRPGRPQSPAARWTHDGQARHVLNRYVAGRTPVGSAPAGIEPRGGPGCSPCRTAGCGLSSTLDSPSVQATQTGSDLPDRSPDIPSE